MMTIAKGAGRIGIAVLAVVAIAVSLALRGASVDPGWRNLPLWIAIMVGGLPLIVELIGKLIRGDFSSDLLAGISIVTSVLLGELLAGTLVVLMLSGGQALEAYAVRRASKALAELARRAPSIAHLQQGQAIKDVTVEQLRIGDQLLVYPHEICPVDGTVIAGSGTMDESYLTGEPYQVPRAPGARVLSGAINGETMLTIRAERLATDSRFASIMQVMREAEQQRPQIRRLADRLGALYTPFALVIAVTGWVISGEPVRFLAVLVVATPCPLLIAIPVALIGAISLAAGRGIIVRDPGILENLANCRTAIFDKTGTLTYGRPNLTETIVTPEFNRDQVLTLVAGLERYSKHPLASAVLEEARRAGLPLLAASSLSEPPGAGLTGVVEGHIVEVTGRKKLQRASPDIAARLPPPSLGLECVVLLDHQLAATFRFRDQLRKDGEPFIRHLGQQHQLQRIMLVSGDREEEVADLAQQAGIHEVYASQSPEQKLEIVRRETALAPTLFVGDGVNDAPALTAASVGIGFGRQSDVTAEAAGAVILDGTLRKVDELLHISRRLRTVALQSAVGGMALSLLGMTLAATGHLPPVSGALFQEVIDVAAVLNALRMAYLPRMLTDY